MEFTIERKKLCNNGGSIGINLPMVWLREHNLSTGDTVGLIVRKGFAIILPVEGKRGVAASDISRIASYIDTRVISLEE